MEKLLTHSPRIQGRTLRKRGRLHSLRSRVALDKLRAIEESNLGQGVWSASLYHLTNRPNFSYLEKFASKDFSWRSYEKFSCRIFISQENSIPTLYYYFFASLKTTCFLSLALYFLSSTLRSTSFLFLRVQYVSPVDLFLSWISCVCLAIELSWRWHLG